jgi:regulator of sirC expression with transglutaminase-like and TPR domain
MKRGILYLQMKYHEQALVDFTRLCELAEEAMGNASGGGG